MSKELFVDALPATTSAPDPSSGVPGYLFEDRLPIDLLGAAVGATGATGPTGATGATGATGPIGLTAYGEMTIDANATTTTLTTHGTWYQVTAGWAAGDLNGFTFTTSDALTCGSAGDYETIAAVSAKSSGSNQQLLFAVAKNGVIITDHIIETKYNNNTDIEAGTVSGIIKGVQIGDIFTLWCQNPNTRLYDCYGHLLQL